MNQLSLLDAPNPPAITERFPSPGAVYVLLALQEFPADRGATCSDLEGVLRQRLGDACPQRNAIARRLDDLADLGLAATAKDQRQGHTGRPQYVWHLTFEGREWTA